MCWKRAVMMLGREWGGGGGGGGGQVFKKRQSPDF